MRGDFLSLVRRPTDLLSALRKIAVGGVIAAAGTWVAAPVTTAAAPAASSGPAAVVPTIVDRSRKASKLILHLPGASSFLRAEHRSHRSHSSHSSHFSSRSGGSTAPVPVAPPPVPAPTGSTTASALDLRGATSANAVTGEVVAIDTDARTIVVRVSETVRSTFAYRDDSKFESTLGVAVRFDEFADANSGRLPVSTLERVQITWRTSPDGKTRIVATAKKVP